MFYIFVPPPIDSRLPANLFRNDMGSWLLRCVYSCRPQQGCHPYGGMWAKAWDLYLMRPSFKVLHL